MKKIKKLINNPGCFLRDYFNKRYPIIRNEISCPDYVEKELIHHDNLLESKIKTESSIDVVYTWVNNQDPTWQSKFIGACEANSQCHLGQYAQDTARFDNHNEIFYSLKSIINYMPWVNKIYVITDSQIPPGIDFSDKIKIVDHREIIDDRYLPTFNSHVIEAHLHKIPGLAEKFIYFNDDVFAARPLNASHFFKSNGIASLFLSNKSLNAMSERGVATPTLSASLKVKALLHRDYQFEIDSPLVHTYIPLRKSMFEFAWDKYHDEIHSFLGNRFRTNNDINVATCLVPWLTYIHGKAFPVRDICYYFNIRSSIARSYYKALEKNRTLDSAPHSFCANDFNSEKVTLSNYHDLLLLNLKKYFSKDNKA